MLDVRDEGPHVGSVSRISAVSVSSTCTQAVRTSALVGCMDVGWMYGWMDVGCKG